MDDAPAWQLSAISTAKAVYSLLTLVREYGSYEGYCSWRVGRAMIVVGRRVRDRFHAEVGVV